MPSISQSTECRFAYNLGLFGRGKKNWKTADLALASLYALMADSPGGNQVYIVANDADMQGAAVVQGHGLEFVITLGTGVGTALFEDGRMLPHFELSHGPFMSGQSIDIALGEASRKAIGKKNWIKRVDRKSTRLNSSHRT